MLMAGCLCALAALLSAPHAYTAERVYAPAIHQSVWYAQTSPRSCELSHPIPLYGIARFHQQAKQNLQFELSAHDAVTESGAVLLSSEHPRWNHLAVSNRIAFADLHTGGTPVRLPVPLALRLLLELENGRLPVFRYTDRDGAPDTIVVRLSNVNFADAMRQFRHCISRLGGNGAAAVARIDVHFALNSATLDQRARPHLDRMAAKIAADPGVSRIVLTGYADRSGARDYNLQLSQRRARSVFDYLTEQGVDETLLEVVAMGESATPEDRSAAAVRRQVTVEILR
jgi:outer membrane protein OmpA-like peptidoglycan-associated protein